MLPTFPSRYLFTIGLKGVFSLAGWSRRIRTGFLVPRATQGTATPAPTARKGLSPAMAGRSSPFRLTVLVRHCGPTTPAAPKRRRFGLFPGRSPLLGESLLFSLPAGTKMFQFPAFASRSMRDAAFRRRVVPFGDLRVNGRLRLTADYRSFPRPSSPP